LTRTPGGLTTIGTGTSENISGLAEGTYTYTVTSSAGCISVPSKNIIINAQPETPASPVQSVDCTLGTGSAVVTVTSPVGADIEYRLDDGAYQGGTSFINVKNGYHTITVRNASGCTATGNSFSVSCGCVNGPEVTLSSTRDTTCGLTAVTVSGNTFGGSATMVTITEDGFGSVSPDIALTSPFTFTYTPATEDAGRTVLITIATDNPLDSPCVAATATYTLEINANPPTPAVGIISQPTCSEVTGSVVLSGLPSDGTWTLIRNPGGVSETGNGTDKTIFDLSAGTYTFTVTNTAGCISELSSDVLIYVQPDIPLMIINNPDPVCSPLNVDLTADTITAGSTPGLMFTYWTDATATNAYETPTAAGSGTYYIKGTSPSGCFDIESVAVTVTSLPIADAGADKVLENEYEITLNAEPVLENETGVWSVISGTGKFYDNRNAKTPVSGLSLNENKFRWTVTNEVCPPSYDSVIIIVHDLEIQTLMTPNMDGINDYFLLKGLNTLGKTELEVFDRRGVQVYKNENYDNLWNGVDYKENPLPDDTYFYVMKTEKGRSMSGFIVIRR
jgi:gliding motility-associated-like protein